MDFTPYEDLVQVVAMTSTDFNDVDFEGGASMNEQVFCVRTPEILNNDKLRIPQREAFERLAEIAADSDSEREIGIVLPVGCGKTGVITLAPFAFESTRALVVAPNLNICDQIVDEFDPTNFDMFYQMCDVLSDGPYPEPAEIRSGSTNLDDLKHADVVVTNIQQLQGDDNRWLESLPDDFFDLILFDEAHHNVATSWESLRSKFSDARIVNLSATPMRADGQRMAGKIVYSYPVAEAIQQGYVKRLKAIALNPRTLKYVRREGGEELEVPLEEVRQLGEDDAGFRRSIVTAEETLATIVDASIGELERIRKETGDRRHKIIASALNYQHCIQIKEAFQARGKEADFVHSREASPANQKVMKRLENHELDVIVQVRKLGEGFDHRHLSVAAVCSIFSSLSPFVQFVGRIMRVVERDDPLHPSNNGTVVFHAGANIASRWEDFQEFSQADQEFFDELLPVEDLIFDNGDELLIEPTASGSNNSAHDSFDVREQSEVMMEEIPLLHEDDEARRAFEILQAKGFSAEDYRQAALQRIPITRQRKRQAARTALDELIQNASGRLLKQHGVNPGGQQLDTKHLGRSNFVVVKAAIDRKVNEHVDRSSNERGEFALDELETIRSNFSELVQEVEEEMFDGTA